MKKGLLTLASSLAILLLIPACGCGKRSKGGCKPCPTVCEEYTEEVPVKAYRTVKVKACREVGPARIECPPPTQEICITPGAGNEGTTKVNKHGKNMRMRGRNSGKIISE